jgi:hypothetical protein
MVRYGNRYEPFHPTQNHDTPIGDAKREKMENSSEQTQIEFLPEISESNKLRPTYNPPISVPDDIFPRTEFELSFPIDGSGSIPPHTAFPSDNRPDNLMPVKRKNTSKGPNPKRQKYQSSITTTSAPVALGNAIRGTAPSDLPAKGGRRVIGRDYAFAGVGTVAAITGFTLIGGVPLTPVCFQSSLLRLYSQSYAKFKINRVAVHYLTASASSQTGNIVMYYEKDRQSPMIDCTNTSFLPFLISDPNAVLGQQWANHTMAITPSDGINSTSYGISPEMNNDTCGSIFLFSKTSDTGSPGHILIDYDITFTEQCINPRAGLYPIARAKWHPCCMGRSATAVTLGVTEVDWVIRGNTIDGAAAAGPSGIAIGDIYKIILDVTNSTATDVNVAWTNSTTSNLLAYSTPGSNSLAAPVDDGFTVYACFVSTATARIYPSLVNAQSDSGAFFEGVTATVTSAVCCMMSYVGSRTSNLQSSY